MQDATPLRCEVAYATAERQWIVAVALRQGATAIEAVEASGLLRKIPELTTAELVLGVHGGVVPAQRELRGGERVEIYRRLKADPRTARRARAARKAR